MDEWAVFVYRGGEGTHKSGKETKENEETCDNTKEYKEKEKDEIMDKRIKVK